MDKKKKRMVIRGLILGLLACAIIYTIYNSATKDKVEVLQDGDKAPDFELVDLEGNTHRLSDYKGQGVFLNFWGTWCEPCKKEMPALERQYQQFKDQGVQVLAVNIAQSNFEVQNYVDQLHLTFPVVIDKTKSVMQAYNVGQLPASFLIDPEGKVKRIPPGELSEQQIQTYMESIKPE
ncbi:thiol-disulfide oxidoreductase ResA [Ureibacillus sp. FSL K6-8385]|uniref:Thiol-disulfide oxidoreductase ResA n=1 Tax=Ureibacillus terrenus TaxID=118246 RepID=A0A540V8E7_9BACL|nr:thiol-disulfide oxidoreductase ResA [Ureibacillus terrenus]MED3660593.1 thiol-disulfide oxidoreductase ResA [Ureibacillus terrenus]MED3762713.1 thiol-disulfide oxidoreductase ResA [Ureibacillus terrenus]TQE92413.1 thiol-disulfide oxidoreductase ResA [Ureibacillus terrenus]